MSNTNEKSILLFVAEEFESKFVSRKWEQVDPEALEKQAVTTSKWDFFDAENPLKGVAAYGSGGSEGSGSEDVDGEPMESGGDANVDGRPMSEEEVKERRSWMEGAGMGDEEKRKVSVCGLVE